MLYGVIIAGLFVAAWAGAPVSLAQVRDGPYSRVTRAVRTPPQSHPSATAMLHVLASFERAQALLQASAEHLEAHHHLLQFIRETRLRARDQWMKMHEGEKSVEEMTVFRRRAEAYDRVVVDQVDVATQRWTLLEHSLRKGVSMYKQALEELVTLWTRGEVRHIPEVWPPRRAVPQASCPELEHWVQEHLAEAGAHLSVLSQRLESLFEQSLQDYQQDLLETGAEAFPRGFTHAKHWDLRDVSLTSIPLAFDMLTGLVAFETRCGRDSDS